jgi:hemerythrin superfamily protein
MDAIRLLEVSHRKVETLFQQIKQNSELQEVAVAKGNFDELYQELSIHTIIEEQVFYPALTKYEGFHDLLEDAFGEHAQARLALSEIAALEPSSREWHNRLEKLEEEINHHVKDEEEYLFPRAREFCSQEELATLGLDLEKAKSSRLNSDLLSQPLTE